MHAYVSPGRPNYESIKNGDEPERYWLLYLPKGVCVHGDPEDEPVAQINRSGTIDLYVLAGNEVRRRRAAIRCSELVTFDGS